MSSLRTKTITIDSCCDCGHHGRNEETGPRHLRDFDVCWFDEKKPKVLGPRCVVHDPWPREPDGRVVLPIPDWCPLP